MQILERPESVVELPEMRVVETDRDRYAANRAAVIAALRRNGARQIPRAVYGRDGRMCFLGLGVMALLGRGRV